ncbi:hypothetical protein B0H13DRAFT_1727355 [Mycena leptocephala]|nr:hypothetical protein B0H13DRAFT_1727355 [Mycena leptocephala]
MSTSVFSLPIPLILLIHLHLLQYPHANKPEYDHNIFDAHVRGLRERTRTMEDVCYFLVTRIEDGKRNIIPTYPCSQPTDTTAFRTSLAKFLENLRHNSIFSAVPSRKQNSPHSKTPVGGVESFAWWWKDVVVRKSLLEECGGERFERLMLALSTHALLKGSAIHVGPHETHGLLRSQPRVYLTRLAAFQSSRNSWVRAAFILNQQQNDLRALRANVESHGGFKKYTSLSTDKLVALADSKLQDLLAVQWAGPSRYSALTFLADLYGLKATERLSPTVSSLSAPGTEATDGSAAAITPPSPLPIAAAHHPATLRKLSKRIFPKEAVDAPSHNPSVASPPHAAIALSGLIDVEARMLQALTDGLARTRKNTKVLTARLASRSVMKIAPSKHTLRSVNMNLWQDTHQISIDFNVMTASALGLSAPGSDIAVESRTDAIRQALLPKYPPVPTAAPLPTTSLPEPTTRRSPPQTPRSVRRLEPPATVKPRSRHALDAHRMARNFSERHPSSDATVHRPSLSSTTQSESKGEGDSERVRPSQINSSQTDYFV